MKASELTIGTAMFLLNDKSAQVITVTKLVDGGASICVTIKGTVETFIGKDTSVECDFVLDKNEDMDNGIFYIQHPFNGSASLNFDKLKAFFVENLIANKEEMIQNMDERIARVEKMQKPELP